MVVQRALADGQIREWGTVQPGCAEGGGWLKGAQSWTDAQSVQRKSACLACLHSLQTVVNHLAVNPLLAYDITDDRQARRMSMARGACRFTAANSPQAGVCTLHSLQWRAHAS